MSHCLTVANDASETSEIEGRLRVCDFDERLCEGRFLSTRKFEKLKLESCQVVRDEGPTSNERIKVELQPQNFHKMPRLRASIESGPMGTDHFSSTP